MQPILTSNELKARIQLLELQSKQQEESLKYRWHLTYQSIKPHNLIKNIFSDASAVPEIRQGMFNTSLGIITGFITRKLLVKKSSGMFKRAAGSAVQVAITRYIAKNFPVIRQKAVELFLKATEKKNGVMHPH